MLQLNHATFTIRISQAVYVHQYILIKETKLLDRFLGHHNVKAHGVKKLGRVIEKNRFFERNKVKLTDFVKL